MAFFQSPSLWVREADGSAELQFEPPGDVVRLDLAMLDDLDEALTRIEREGRFRRLVFRSLRGAQLSAQGPDAATWRRKLDLDRWAERGQALFTRLRKLPMPSLAWVEGACLGPGLELEGFARAVGSSSSGSAATVPRLLRSRRRPCAQLGSVGPLLRRTGFLAGVFPLVLAGRRLTASEAMSLGVADRMVSGGDTPIVDDAETLGQRPASYLATFRFRDECLGPASPLPAASSAAEEASGRGPARPSRRLRSAAQDDRRAGRRRRSRARGSQGRSIVTARQKIDRRSRNLLRFHRGSATVAVPEKSTAPAAWRSASSAATPLGMHLTLESGPAAATRSCSARPIRPGSDWRPSA